MSGTDYTDQLNALRLLARRRPELNARVQTDQLVLYAGKLRGYDRRDVDAVLARTWKFWPDWSELEEALSAARDDRTAEVRSQVARGWQPDLSQAANIALGFLANCHLRELDRMRDEQPEVRQQLVNDLARWFQPYAADVAKAEPPRWRQLRDEVTAWV